MYTLDDILNDNDEKEHAIHFLNKIFNTENNLNLSDIKKSLELDFIKKHIEKIRYNDIVNNGEKNNILRNEDNKYEKYIYDNFNKDILESL